MSASVRDASHASTLPGHSKPTPLVRYSYNAQGDLAEVDGRDGQRTRQFAYDSAHRMVAHRAGTGPGHSYVYEDQTPAAQQKGTPLRPGARVVEQHNEEGLSYFFEYRDATAPAQTTPATAEPTDTQSSPPNSLPSAKCWCATAWAAPPNTTLKAAVATNG